MSCRRVTSEISELLSLARLGYLGQVSKWQSLIYDMRQLSLHASWSSCFCGLTIGYRLSAIGYRQSGAGVMNRLPFTRLALVVITSIFKFVA
jgi:hypothetical protein